MKDHPPQPPKPEVVLPDAGGWVSGPSAITEPVPAGQIEIGDKLLLDSGIAAEVDFLRDGFYTFPDGHQQGVSIGWRAGSSTGLLFRRATDVLQRLTGDPS